MNKLSLVILMTLAGLAGSANAQAPQSGITESTDPAKIAQIEQHAQALGHNATAPAPAAGNMMHGDKPMHEMEYGDKHHGKHHGHKHHGKRHHGATDHRMMHEPKADAAAMPAAPVAPAKP